MRRTGTIAHKKEEESLADGYVGQATKNPAMPGG